MIQLASDNAFAQPSVLFSVGLFSKKTVQEPNFLFANLWRINVFREIWRIRAKYALLPQKIACSYTYAMDGN